MHNVFISGTTIKYTSCKIILYKYKMINNILLGFAVLLIIFSLYHFTFDLYLVLYKMYYDSTYLTQLSNSYNQYIGKWL